MAAIRIGLTVVLLLAASRAAAQVTVGAEYDRDRFTYHFDTTSSSFFEQRYNADNVWIVGTVRYVAGIPLVTTAGFTPSRDSTADDYDTFVDATGTLVSGTTGPISIHSWRIGQLAEVARVGHAALTLSYRLRADTSDFRVGHKTVVQNGVTIAAFDVTTPEFTSSMVHEIAGGVRMGGFRAELAPATLGRLVVQLPDKYPGQDLVYLAKGAAGSASFTVTRSHVSFAVDVQHAWSYSSTASLSRNILAVRLSVSP
ncbi:MAG TPA: hypothetical protein VFA59_22605 [Vicinamibacterales bacterium]|nr:hypothetical protein [Vicinamibacterales bacterium]